MAAWKFACKTMLGMNLDLKLIGRENLPLRLTRAVSGSGSVNPTQLMSLTEITGLTQELQLLDAVEHIGENVVMIPVILRNSDVKKKYDMYQLGIYAEDPDLGEILYIVLQSESAEEIPAAAEMKDFKLEWYINLSVSNADHIEVVIDETGVLTVEQGDARYVDQTVYGTDRDRWNNGSATYGTCETAAGTTAKTVACTGFKLAAGAEITVKFTVTNTASNPTLNVNGSGAKPIYYRGAAISAGYLAAGRTYDFRYNGTQWDLVGDINTNTTYGPMTAATADAAGKAGLVPAPGAGKQTSYLRGDGTWAVPTNTTYSVMTGATASAAGKSGLVPAPAAGTQGEVLKGDGTWDLVENLPVSFSQASNRANITSKEALKTSLGKIMKWFADLAAGAASTLLGSNLTASRALVSNASGKVAVSAVTSTELGYLDGVTSNVQTQLDALNTGIEKMGKLLLEKGYYDPFASGSVVIPGISSYKVCVGFFVAALSSPMIGINSGGYVVFTGSVVIADGIAPARTVLTISGDTVTFSAGQPIMQIYGLF